MMCHHYYVKDKYITWHIRCNYRDFNKNKYASSNIEDDEFKYLFEKIKNNFPKYKLLIISDTDGCNMAKQWSLKYGLGSVLTSKDFSNSFVGDLRLVLGSEAYIQFLSGGMAFVAMYSKKPFLIAGIGSSSVDLINDEPEKFWFEKEQNFVRDIRITENKRLAENQNVSNLISTFKHNLQTSYFDQK